MVRYIPNEVSQVQVVAGFEDDRGVAAVPDFRLLGEFAASKSQALNRKEETTGGYVRMVTPRKELPSYSGTYGEDLNFETFPQLLRAAIKGGGAGTLVPGSAAVYDYTKSPSKQVDDIETMTVQYGAPGIGMQSRGVTFNEFTVAIDTDDADGVWKWSGPLYLRTQEDLPGGFDGVATGGTVNTVVMTGAAWVPNAYAGAYLVMRFGSGVGEVRQVVSNTADTLTVSTPFATAPAASTVFRIEGQFLAGIAIPDYEAISSYGTKVFLDPLGTALGTTQIRERIISANITASINRTGKRFLENKDEMAARTGRGSLLITGQIRFEFDRRDEWRAWEELDGFGVRIEQTGDEIEPGFAKRARIDIPNAYWDEPSPDTRESNITNTLSFVAYDADPYAVFGSRIGLPVLP